MDHIMYTAMGAARQTLDQQAVTANNLANASTPGFRAKLFALRAVPINGDGLTTRTLVTASTPGTDRRQGRLEHTERPLDVALQQDGFLAVQRPDGSEAYTRNGNIQLSADGQMTIQGYPVIGDNGPIDVPPQTEIAISKDGVISALNSGDALNTVAQLGRLKLVNAQPSQLRLGDDGLFHLTAKALQQGDTLDHDPQIQIIPGALEGSNVKPIETLTDMIDNARRFEMQMKVIHSADENKQRANQLLAMN